MKYFMIAIIIGFAMVIGATIASATGKDQGRRLSGPFCVSLKTGVVRSIPLVQKCKTGEVRKVGVAVPDVDPVNTGPKGDTGPQGPRGNDGAPASSNKRQLCLVPDTDTTVLYNKLHLTGATGASGVVPDTQYSLLNRACTDSDYDAIDLTVLVP